MKKVLIIANLFHASPRITGLTKYLNLYGWEPIILTTPLGTNSETRFGGPDSDFLSSGIRIIETDYKPAFYLIKKIFGLGSHSEEREELKNRLELANEGLLFKIGKWIYDHIIDEIFYYPDPEKSWEKYAFASAKEILEKEHVDAVLSSSSPVITHVIAKNIKEAYAIPWIADLRDLWSQNHNYPYGNIRRFFDRRFELNILVKSDALVTVSPMWAEQLSILHNNRMVYSITNGFDPEKINEPPYRLLQKFVISYTGQLYVNEQNPSKFFNALVELLSEKLLDINDIEVRFYGPENSYLKNLIKEKKLSGIVKHYGIISREESKIKQKESQVLLLFNWDSHKEIGWYPLKIFEYLAAQRPILAIGGYREDVIRKLLDETHAGTHAPSLIEIKDALLKYYNEYKKNGIVKFEGRKEIIERFDYKQMARQFSDILNKI